MTNTNDIATLYEAGCEDAGRDRVCRSRGGESCAFDGAMIVLQPIADAAHVVHGPISCCANTWAGRGAVSGAGDLHRRGFCSDTGELDIVYGAEGKLLATVVDVAERVRPSAVFVYATCVSGLAGEDIAAVCRTAAEQTGVPCIPVDAPGFVGPKNLGNRIAGEALVDHVIGTAEPRVTTPTDIAIIGEYNIAGDLELVLPLLERAGIRVLSRVTGGATFQEVRHAHRARTALLVCGRALINVAKHLRDRYGVPYVEGSFFGSTETARALRSIADSLQAASPEAAGVRARVDAVIAEREAWLAGRLAGITNLAGRRAVLYSGGVKSWAMVAALRDLGVEVAAVGSKKTSYEDEAKVRELLGPDASIVEDVSPEALRRLMSETGSTVLVAGGRNRFLAAKEGWPFIDVNQERHAAYAGYEGLVNLALDLSRTVEFYEREKTADIPTGSGAVGSRRHPAVIDPGRSSASLGAVMALQGVDGAIPVLHGAQGCSFLEKVALVKHFEEPVALVTTRLFVEEIVLGSESRLAKVVTDTLAAQRPSLVGVVTTALVEVKGDDVEGVARDLTSPLAPVLVIPAHDHEGGLESGWSAAVDAIVRLAEPGRVDPALVTLLAGPHLTPGDIAELRDMVEGFDLVPVFVPDVSAMDGSRAAFGPLAEGGVSVGELRSLGAAAHTLVLGSSLEHAACELRERFGTPYSVFDGISSLRDVDRFVEVLTLLSGRPAPASLTRRRRAFVDAMRDAHLLLGGARVGLAMEPDHALQVSRLLWEAGCDAVCAVVAADTPAARKCVARDVFLGDLADVPDGVEVLISSSHARDSAHRIGADLVTLGFPAHGRFGAARRTTVGYRGAGDLLAEIAVLMHARRAPRHTGTPATEGARRS